MDDPLPRDATTTDEPAKTSVAVWLFLIVAIVGMIVMQAVRPRPEPVGLGLPLPALMVEGWLPADASVDGAALEGQVVLLEFWSTTCPQCRVLAPQLASYYERFQDQGLTMIGLTPEPRSYLPRIESYLGSLARHDWPVGYGAGMMSELLGVPGTPTLVLFDHTGKSVWWGHSLYGLDEATSDALARSRESEVSL